MKIAVLTSLYPSAARPNEGIFAERRWARMRARGHAVHVVHPLPWAPVSLGREDWRDIIATAPRETREEIEVEHPRYFHVPRLALGNARRFARTGVAAILAHGAPDVVVADYAWPAAAAADELAQRGLPLLVSGRGSDVLQVAGEARLASALAHDLRRAGQWCAVSQHLVDAMDALAAAPGRGVLVPNGVDLEQFAPRDPSAARRALRWDFEGLLVLVVGHLIERKDPLLALAAFADLDATLGEHTQIVFIGRGPLQERLLAEINGRGLDARAHVIGEVPPDELATWYSAADAVLLTSSREGRPNVVLEALASGVPVLATDAGGTAELLTGLEGMLARTRDPRELAHMLAALLARDHDRGRLRAQVAPLSWERSLEALEGCLDAALAGKVGAAR